MITRRRNLIQLEGGKSYYVTSDGFRVTHVGQWVQEEGGG
jgi:hypothetical protein